MENTKYTWIKGRIFQRKDETTPFRIGVTQSTSEAYNKFTIRHSKKRIDGSYENTFFDCIAFGETAELIDSFKLGKGDNILCKAVKKEREYNGTVRTNYTVYEIFKQLEKPKVDATVNQAVAVANQVKAQPANQSEFNFDDVANETEATGKEVEIPF